jgi:hypothetical protein
MTPGPVVAWLDHLDDMQVGIIWWQKPPPTDSHALLVAWPVPATIRLVWCHQTSASIVAIQNLNRE